MIFRKLVLFLIIAALLISGCAEYNPEIHNEKIDSILSDPELKKYILNESNDNHQVDISKSDKKVESEYADGKLYEYNIFIQVNSAFLAASKTKQFDYVDEIASVFGKTLVANDSSFRGIYDRVFVRYGNYGDDDYMSLSMNIQGIRTLNYKTRDEYRLLYYDRDENPVYDE